MNKKDDLIYSLYSDNRTVFRLKDVAMLVGDSNLDLLKAKLNYYVHTGRLLNIRKGLYCKTNYSKEELACRIFTPAYISLEYVLQRAGVVFQYDSRISVVSYLTREIEVDAEIYSYRKMKGELLVSAQGVIQQDDRIAIASPERAFLDLLYLNASMYFDNLRPLNWEKIEEILPIYNSKLLCERAKKIMKNGLK